MKFVYLHLNIYKLYKIIYDKVSFSTLFSNDCPDIISSTKAVFMGKAAYEQISIVLPGYLQLNSKILLLFSFSYSNQHPLVSLAHSLILIVKSIKYIKIFVLYAFIQ